MELKFLRSNARHLVEGEGVRECFPSGGDSIAPFFVDGLGGGEGGELWNRRADVYSLGRWLLRVRFCSPLRSDGGARVPGVVVVSNNGVPFAAGRCQRRVGEEFVPSVDCWRRRSGGEDFATPGRSG